jgi:hypothetical protein
MGHLMEDRESIIIQASRIREWNVEFGRRLSWHVVSVYPCQTLLLTTTCTTTVPSGNGKRVIVIVAL